MKPLITLLAGVLIACGGGDSGGEPDADPTPEPRRDFSRDILSTDLTVDVSAMSATAVITIAGSTTTTGASFEIGDLTISSVTTTGGALEYATDGARVDIGVPTSTEPVTMTIEYAYSMHSMSDGVIDNGLTLTWPYYCGNVFPCKSGPADGLEFTLEITGVPDGDTAVYPEAIPADAPSYMLAWAINDYTYIDLGATSHGTQVGAWYLPGGEAMTTTGTQNLHGVVQWFEDTLGEYIFGDEVAAVSAQWGLGAFGGMEHHPFWHVGSTAMGSQEVQAHEAAHGWFGNGVRMACWEDFVLSEGTVTYLAARSLGEVGGQALGDGVWAGYESDLQTLQNGNLNKIAWPEGCNQIDILAGLFGDAPYIKGAMFYRDVEAAVGTAMFDAAIGAFYTEYKGQAATMQDMLDTIAEVTGWDPTTCANAWLRSMDLPPDGACD
jgi:hypothetical protein